MEAEAIIGLAAANLAACMTPGQNTALVTATAARCGWIGGLWTILGVLLAEAVWTTVAFLAVAGVISLEQDVHAMLNVGCGLALAVFGILLLAAPAEPAAASEPRRLDGRRVPRLVLGGALVGLANPMALLFFIAVLPLFVSETDGPALVAATVAVCITTALALAPFLLASSSMLPRLGRVVLHRAGCAALVATGMLFASGAMH